MRIGIVVVTKEEQRPFFKKLGRPIPCTTGEDGYIVQMWCLNDEKSVFMILSGPSEIAAASSTQYLIDNFFVDEIISYAAHVHEKEATSTIITCNRNRIPCVLTKNPVTYVLG